MSEFWSRLTPEQKELSKAFYEKWDIIAKSTERINYQAATEAITKTYISIGRNTPSEILFFDSPYAVIEKIQKYKKDKTLSFDLYRRFEIELAIRPRNSVRYQLKNLPQIYDSQNAFLNTKYRSISQLALLHKVSIQFWSWRYVWLLDFAYSVLGCDYISEQWEAVQLLVENCGYIQPFNNICFVSDRPTELIFNNDNILHAENKPAIVFSDGYQIFAYNGVELSITF
jgi:hypothetical protein